MKKSHDVFLSETRLWGSYDLWSHGRLCELVRESYDCARSSVPAHCQPTTNEKPAARQLLRHGRGLGSSIGWVGRVVSEIFMVEMGWVGFSYQNLYIFRYYIKRTFRCLPLTVLIQCSLQHFGHCIKLCCCCCCCCC